MDDKKKTLREMGFKTVVAAAVKFGDDLAIGNTHSGCGRLQKIRYSDSYDDPLVGLKRYIGGYIDSTGKFINEDTAWAILDSCGLLEGSPQTFTHHSARIYDIGKSEYDLAYAKQKIEENLKLRRLKEKEELNDMVFGNNKYEAKQQQQNKFAIDYLAKLKYAETTDEAKESLSDRINIIMSR